MPTIDRIDPHSAQNMWLVGEFLDQLVSWILGGCIGELGSGIDGLSMFVNMGVAMESFLNTSWFLVIHYLFWLDLSAI